MLKTNSTWEWKNHPLEAKSVWRLWKGARCLVHVDTETKQAVRYHAQTQGLADIPVPSELWTNIALVRAYIDTLRDRDY